MFFLPFPRYEVSKTYISLYLAGLVSMKAYGFILKIKKDKKCIVLLLISYIFITMIIFFFPFSSVQVQIQEQWVNFINFFFNLLLPRGAVTQINKLEILDFYLSLITLSKIFSPSEVRINFYSRYISTINIVKKKRKVCINTEKMVMISTEAIEKQEPKPVEIFNDLHIRGKVLSYRIKLLNKSGIYCFINKKNGKR